MEQKEQYKTLKALSIAFVGAGVALGGAHLVGWNNQVDVSKLATTADVKVISDSLNSSVSADNSLLVRGWEFRIMSSYYLVCILC